MRWKLTREAPRPRVLQVRASWAHNLRQITSDRLQAHAPGRLLIIEHIVVIFLLHYLELAHLYILLSLPLLPLLIHGHQLLPLVPLDFFIHPRLVHLIVEHVFV